jgi:hypothetical protein
MMWSVISFAFTNVLKNIATVASSLCQMFWVILLKIRGLAEWWIRKHLEGNGPGLTEDGASKKIHENLNHDSLWSCRDSNRDALNMNLDRCRYAEPAFLKEANWSKKSACSVAVHLILLYICWLIFTKSRLDFVPLEAAQRSRCPTSFSWPDTRISELGTASEPPNQVPDIMHTNLVDLFFS